jgi:predicted lipoprotein with Yx(FWY)xxD motif
VTKVSQQPVKAARQTPRDRRRGLGGHIARGSLCLFAVSAVGLTATPLSGAATAKAVVVKTRPTSLGTVLATANGFTLYRFTHDSAAKVTCTGGCASLWPPLTLTKGAKVVGMKGLGTVKDPDGARQVTYHGYPLYRYTGDTAPGQVHGQGLDGAWFVVKATAASTSTPATSKSSGGGYGY